MNDILFTATFLNDRHTHTKKVGDFEINIIGRFFSLDHFNMKAWHTQCAEALCEVFRKKCKILII